MQSVATVCRLLPLQAQMLVRQATDSSSPPPPGLAAFDVSRSPSHAGQRLSVVACAIRREQLINALKQLTSLPQQQDFVGLQIKMFRVRQSVAGITCCCLSLRRQHHTTRHCAAQAEESALLAAADGLQALISSLPTAAPVVAESAAAAASPRRSALPGRF